MRYFQNSRSRRDNTLQVVKARKRTSLSKSADVPVKHYKAEVLSLFGVKNYLPPRPSGETDDTIADMVKIMQTQKHSDARMDDLMNQTFADRRKMIVTDEVGIRELKTQYPCLFRQDQVS